MTSQKKIIVAKLGTFHIVKITEIHSHLRLQNQLCIDGRQQPLDRGHQCFRRAYFNIGRWLQIRINTQVDRGEYHVLHIPCQLKECNCTLQISYAVCLPVAFKSVRKFVL